MEYEELVCEDCGKLLKLKKFITIEDLLDKGIEEWTAKGFLWHRDAAEIMMDTSTDEFYKREYIKYESILISICGTYFVEAQEFINGRKDQIICNECQTKDLGNVKQYIKESK